MPILKTRQGASILLTAGALLLAALAIAPQADASTYYACVKKKGGAVRFVSKSTKCKKGESKASWSSEGPAGKNGANGTNGTNGANGTNGTNGAVAGYSATQSGIVALPISLPGEEVEVEVLEKTLPAGHYLISAKVETFAKGKTEGLVATRCELYDAGTKATLDTSEWGGVLGKFGAGVFIGSTTLPLQAVLNSSSSHAIQVWCENPVDNPGEGEVHARRGQLFAVQTSGNS